MSGCVFCPEPLKKENLPFLGLMCGPCQKNLAGWCQLPRDAFKDLTGKDSTERSAWLEQAKWNAGEPNLAVEPPVEPDAISEDDLVTWARQTERPISLVEAHNLIARLDILNPRQRRAVELVVLNAWSLRDAAQEMGLSYEMVRKHVIKAGRALRLLVDKNALSD